MYKAFKYRLRPTRQQTRAMLQMLETHRRLYNRALAARKAAWEQEKRSVSFFEQSAQLPAARAADPYLAVTNATSCQATLRRLDRAFQAFFRRVRAGEKAGYPRFKSRDRFDTVEFKSYGDGCKVEGERVYFQHVGKVRVVLHRPIEGKIKTLSFTRRVDAWYVVAVCDLGEQVVAPHSGPAVGIDVGLTHFATLSTGEQIANPRFFRKDEQALARAQRQMSKEAKGTPERERRKRVVRHIYARIANRRADFAHKLSRRLANEFSLIIFEDLNIGGMLKNHSLAKSISDAAWSQLITYAQRKAEEAGAVCIQVDPRGTSQRCSGCSDVVQKDLSERVHRCPACGLEIDRDLNAALNILAVGLHSVGEIPKSCLNYEAEQSPAARPSVEGCMSTMMHDETTKPGQLAAQGLITLPANTPADDAARAAVAPQPIVTYTFTPGDKIREGMMTILRNGEHHGYCLIAEAQRTVAFLNYASTERSGQRFVESVARPRAAQGGR